MAGMNTEDKGGIHLVVRSLEIGQAKPAKVTGVGNATTALMTLKTNSMVVTATSNIATLTAPVAVVTTPSLATAAAASQTEVLTLPGVTATDLVFVQWGGGTNTGGTPIIKAVPTTDTVTVTLLNKDAAVAFNGTFVLFVWVLKG